jgi:hypothetical protein
MNIEQRLTIHETKRSAGARCEMIMLHKMESAGRQKKRIGWPSLPYTQNLPEMLAIWRVLILVNWIDSPL